MIKQTITYEDFSGVERTEDFYFHFNQAELQEWDMRYGMNLHEQLQAAIVEENWNLVTDTLKHMVTASYGRKSPDGKSFIKTPELTNHFVGTDAYSQLFIKLISDQEFSTKFANGIVPKNIAEGRAELDFRKPGQQTEQPMNREQRRAQPQDYQQKQVKPTVAAPKVEVFEEAQPQVVASNISETDQDDFLAWQKARREQNNQN